MNWQEKMASSLEKNEPSNIEVMEKVSKMRPGMRMPVSEGKYHYLSEADINRAKWTLDNLRGQD